LQQSLYFLKLIVFLVFIILTQNVNIGCKSNVFFSVNLEIKKRMAENIKKLSTKTASCQAPNLSPEGSTSASSGSNADNLSGPENSERFYRLLERFQKLCFYKRRLNGEFTFVSNRITDLLGYSPNEFTTQWESCLTDNLHNKSGMQRFKQGFREKEPESFDVEFFHKDGRRLWLEIFESPVLDSHGGILTVEGIARDITQRKLREENLRFSEARYREMSESSPIGIFQIDPDDDYVFVNSRWQVITGMPLKEILGTTWWRVIHPDDQDEVFLNWAKAEEDDLEFFTECRILRPDGGLLWVELRTRFLFHGPGKFTFGTIEDITARKQSEGKLERFAEELQRSNRALDDFAGIASHDLQEPLRKIIAFAERINKDYSSLLDERGRDYLNRMQRATGRMQTFIQDLLEFSRITTKARPFEPTDLEALVAEALHDLEARIAQTGGKVETENLPTIDADPFQMRQFFQNLIGNGLKFHKPGENPLIKVSAAEDPDEGVWRIKVEDNGVGFEEKYLERIFKPFERLHGRSQYEGSGMGLAICEKIAARHGARLTARSRLGEGACFILTIPAKQ